MAFSAGGGGLLPKPNPTLGTYVEGGNARFSHHADRHYDTHDEYDHYYGSPKLQRLLHTHHSPSDTCHRQVFHTNTNTNEQQHWQMIASPAEDDMSSTRNRSFFIIRERYPTPEEVPSSVSPLTNHGLSSCSMERTESGLSISSDTSQHSHHDEHDESENGMLVLVSDLAAAQIVRDHVTRRNRNTQGERILKTLISPKFRGADTPLDNDALGSIFSAANELFFANRLTQRVAWDWSHPSHAKYESHIVGTTALRRSAHLLGYETLIVLSSPILKDTKYNRRLLISTFLHEMIHSFLFITCGMKAGEDGGHTPGFRSIAEIIDNWVGKEHLRLSDMEAHLEYFRGGEGDEEITASITAHDGACCHTGRVGVDEGLGFVDLSRHRVLAERKRGSQRTGSRSRRYRNYRWEMYPQESFRSNSPHDGTGRTYV